MSVNFLVDYYEREMDNYISDVRVVFEESGKSARISFCHARSHKYDYGLVYEITEEEYQQEITLQDIISSRRSVDIIDQRYPHDHTVVLSEIGIRCVIYPARYNSSDNTYYLIEQKENNTTELLRMLPTIDCVIRYETMKKRIGPFKVGSSKMRKAILYITGKRPVPGSYLIYRCMGAGRERRKYGIDIANFWGKECEILIKKEETIQILPPMDNQYRLKKK